MIHFTPWRMPLRRVAGAVLLSMAFIAAPALAKVSCGPLGVVGERLKNQYGEHLTAQAISAQGHVVAVYRSDAGFYTVLKVTVAGHACPVDYGEGWELVATSLLPPWHPVGSADASPGRLADPASFQ